MAGMQLVPNSAIRNAGFGFNDLIFDQIKMIKLLERDVFLSSAIDRKGKILALFQSIRGLETIIWGKIEGSTHYKGLKDELELDFETLTKNGLTGQMKFMDNLDAWQKLLSLHLRAFDFYPATSVDFISGVGLKK